MSAINVPICLVMRSDGNAPNFISYNPSLTDNIFTMNFLQHKFSTIYSPGRITVGYP